MKVRALRGVCIGVNRHLAVGDEADLEPATTQFLKSIGAVEDVPSDPPPAETEQPTSAPAKSGKKEK